MGGVSGQACVLRPGGVCSRDSAPGNGVSCFPLRKDCTCCSMLKDVRFGHHYAGDRGSREGPGEGPGEGEGRLSLDRPHSVRSKVAREEWVCGDGWKGGALSPVCL